MKKIKKLLATITMCMVAINSFSFLSLAKEETTELISVEEYIGVCFHQN